MNYWFNSYPEISVLHEEITLQFTSKMFCPFSVYVVIKLSIIVSFENTLIYSKQKFYVFFALFFSHLFSYHFTHNFQNKKTNFFVMKILKKWSYILVCLSFSIFSSMEWMYYIYTLMLFWCCVIKICNEIRLHNYRNPLSMKKREIYFN